MDDDLDLAADRALLGGVGAITPKSAPTNIEDDREENLRIRAGLPDFAYRVYGSFFSELSIWKARIHKPLGANGPGGRRRDWVSYSLVECICKNPGSKVQTSYTRKNGTVSSEWRGAMPDFHLSLLDAMCAVQDKMVKWRQEARYHIASQEKTIRDYQLALEEERKRLEVLENFCVQDFIPSDLLEEEDIRREEYFSLIDELAQVAEEEEGGGVLEVLPDQREISYTLSKIREYT